MKLCQGSKVLVTAHITGIDKYQRSLGQLQCNYIYASRYLAEHGLAWHYAQYSINDEIYKLALNARQQRLGLWANEAPIPP